jgi:hypothetical protein
MPTPTIPTTTIPGVEIARSGTYHASTGDVTFTREHFDSAVAAFLDPKLRNPVIKLGHDGKLGDSAPAVGRVTNLRVSEVGDGVVLVGDLVVPTSLAAIAPIAYPARSIEGAFNYQTSPRAARYPFVMTGVALLGEQLPAIEELNDLYDLFESKVAAKGPSKPVLFTRMEENMSVKASVRIDAVVDQFYDQLGQASWAYVREVWSDFIIVEGTDGELYRVEWTDNGDGLVTFGAPERVMVTYVADADSFEDGPVPSSAALLSRISAPGSLTRAATSGQSEVMEETTENIETVVDQVIADETVEANAETELAIDETTTDEVVEEVAETVEVAAAAAQQVAVLASQLPVGFEIITSDNLVQLRGAQTELANLREAQRVETREAFLRNACEVEGRIAPAQLDDMRTLFDANETACRSFVAKCAAGTIPTTALGSAKLSDGQQSVDSIIARFRALK